MNLHPEIFEGEDLKGIEKGRNSDWSKEYFVRQKAETIDAMDEYLDGASAEVFAMEDTLEDLNKKVDEKVNAMVENEAQKEFMRYAFLENPKTALGRLVSGAWRKFREWWDEHKREVVEKKTSESVLAKLNEQKKEIAEEPRRKLFHNKHHKPELD